MKKRFIIFLTILISSSKVFSQMDESYSKFLIFKSQAIDYYPVWGQTDNEIYINLMSKEWRKYDLSKTKIQAGTYLEHQLAINTADNFIIVKDDKLKKKLESDEKWKPREIFDKNNRKISLESENFNAALYIEYEKGKKEKIMNIQGNAHSLAISPSGKYVACLFELSGLFIFDIQKEINNIQKKNEAIAKMSNLEKADFYMKNRDFPSFETTVNNFTSKEKETIEYNYYFGLICYVKSENDSTLSKPAIEHLLKSSDDSRFYDSNILLGILYHSSQDWQNSVKYADRSIELIPEDPTGYTLKAKYYEYQGNQALACEFYKKAFEKGDQYAQIKLSNCK
jgi:hypothetical protein